MFKKVCILILITLITVSIAGCGTTKENHEEIVPVDEEITITISKPEPISDSVNTDEIDLPQKTAEDTAVTEDVKVLIGGATLSANYPEEIFPVYPDSYILSVLESDNNYVIVAYSEENPSEVIAYYEEVVKSANITALSKTETNWTTFGVKDGYTFTLDVGENIEMEGYLTQITINFFK